MECPSCGAPMTLVGSRNYFYCSYCGQFYFPPTDEDGVKVLEKAAQDIRCPLCHEPLYKASIDGHPGYRCQQCRGILTDQQSFAAIVAVRRARASGPVEPLKPIDPAELKREIDCPLCRKRMDTHPYYGPGNIVIDHCPHCRMIWLDYGELAQIEKAPGRGRGHASI